MQADSANVRILPGYIFVACLVAGIAVELWLPALTAELPQPVSFFAGLAIALVALLFIALGAGKFAVSQVNPMPYKPAAHLVTGGVYRLTRNPMYVGAVLMLVGIGVAAGSAPIVVSALPLFLFLNYHVIRREEAYLERAFGPDYLDYCRKVRRWL